MGGQEKELTQMAQSEQEILEGLAEIVNEETGLDTESVQTEKSFTDDLDIDSLSMMTIVTHAEDKFSVRIPDEEVKNLNTVGDAVTYIAGAQACDDDASLLGHGGMCSFVAVVRGSGGGW
jgi:acyl carrier protein